MRYDRAFYREPHKNNGEAVSFGISFVVHGKSVAFARAGAMGKRRFTPTPQRNYMMAVAQKGFEAMSGHEPVTCPVGMVLEVEYLVPSSWSAKRKAAATWKTSKPDADNLAKIVKDALSKIVYADDAQVVSLIVRKMYGPYERSTISILSLE
jgi:Holliday junction resolvase RusA-like endonuclease